MIPKAQGLYIYLTSGLFSAIHCRIQSKAGGYNWRYWCISGEFTIKMDGWFLSEEIKVGAITDDVGWWCLWGQMD